MQHLGGLEAEGLDPVEDALARAEQDGRDVEGEFVDHSGGQRLSDGRGPTGDVDPVAASGVTRRGLGRVEAVGDEGERRPPKPYLPAVRTFKGGKVPAPSATSPPPLHGTSKSSLRLVTPEYGPRCTRPWGYRGRPAHYPTSSLPSMRPRQLGS